MSTPRRIVRKIELPHEKGFDTEFWPVVVAMSVLAAIVIGAIRLVDRQVALLVFFSTATMAGVVAA